MNRRDFIKSVAFGSVAGLSLDSLAIGTAFAHAPQNAFVPQARDRLTHLVTRLTYGMSPDLYEHVRQIGEDAFIEEQLNPDNIDDAFAESLVDEFPLYQQTSAEILADYRGERREIVNTLIGLTLQRAIYSKRGLYEVMVDFWSNHFNIYIGKGISLILKIADDRDVIRPHALGKFRDLLHASAKSPAMLFYLDNALSNATHPNENYARELLELHTLGVYGGYTEQDMKQVARAFTGWSIQRQQDLGEDVGEFRFRPAWHDDGDVTVLGVTISGEGMSKGEQILDLLATHPSTAKFISTKLVRRFVADNPPDRLVEACTQTFLSSDGDIRAVLRTIFTSEEFWNAPPKFKRPLDYFVSVLRAVNFEVKNPALFRRNSGDNLNMMGQVPFTWAAPNGFPDVSSYWLQNLLPRWNLAISSTSAQRIGEPNFERLSNLFITRSADYTDALAQYVLGRALTDTERTIMDEFAQTVSPDIAQQQTAILVLLLASPAFQYR